jgi:peroxiredoxin
MVNMATDVVARGRVGDTMPDITLPKLDGGELEFGSLRGKKVLLFFWGSW